MTCGPMGGWGGGGGERGGFGSSEASLMIFMMPGTDKVVAQSGVCS